MSRVIFGPRKAAATTAGRLRKASYTRPRGEAPPGRRRYKGKSIVIGTNLRTQAQAVDHTRVRKTFRGPAPKNMRRNSAKRVERLLVRKEIFSFSAAVKFMDFLFQVLSTRSVCGPAGISRVTESPNMSSATDSPSRETII